MGRRDGKEGNVSHAHCMITNVTGLIYHKALSKHQHAQCTFVTKIQLSPWTVASAHVEQSTPSPLANQVPYNSHICPYSTHTTHTYTHIHTIHTPHTHILHKYTHHTHTHTTHIHIHYTPHTHTLHTHIHTLSCINAILAVHKYIQIPYMHSLGLCITQHDLLWEGQASFSPCNIHHLVLILQDEHIAGYIMCSHTHTHTHTHTYTHAHARALTHTHAFVMTLS